MKSNKIKQVIEDIKQKALKDFFYFVYNFMDVKSQETGRSIIHKDPHKEVCDYATLIGRKDTSLKKDLMILLPREFGKTFLAELFIIWYSLVNPNDIILLICSNLNKAEGILDAVKMMIRTNQKLINTFGENLLNRLGNSRYKLTLNKRTVSTREKNVQALGIDSSYTGYRADILLFEDIIGDDYNQSPAVKAKIDNSFFNATRPLLKKTGSRIYIGTRWSYDDIPGQIKLDPIVSKKWHIIEKSIENDEGNSAYPHIVTDEQLQSIKDEVKSNAYYASQYLNNPRNEGDSVFYPEDYQEYAYTELPAIESYIMGVDLATSTSGTADDRALVIIGIGKNNYLYVVDCYASNKISYTKFYDVIKQYAVDYYKVDKILIEINNAQPIFDQYKNLTVERGDFLPLIPISHSNQSKISRINTLENPLQRGYLRLPYDYKNNSYFRILIDTQMQYFNTKTKKNYDDLLDAMETAYAEATKRNKIINSKVSVVENREYNDAIW